MVGMGLGPEGTAEDKLVRSRGIRPDLCCLDPGCSLSWERQKPAECIYTERAEKQQERLFWRLGG
jgi:hypothetical protein